MGYAQLMSKDSLGSDFAAGMPEAYRKVFDAAAIAEHAAIVARRGTRRLHIERWRTLPNGLVVVCMVAPDRGGLLSALSMALAKHDLAIVSAQIYTSTSTPEPEAVDFFWLNVGDWAESRVDQVLEQVETLASQQLTASS